MPPQGGLFLSLQTRVAFVLRSKSEQRKHFRTGPISKLMSLAAKHACIHLLYFFSQPPPPQKKKPTKQTPTLNSFLESCDWEHTNDFCAHFYPHPWHHSDESSVVTSKSGKSEKQDWKATQLRNLPAPDCFAPQNYGHCRRRLSTALHDKSFTKCNQGHAI